MPSKERQNADLTGKANPDTAMHNVCNERQNAHKIIERQNANLTGKANAHSALKAMQDTSASQDESASEDKSRRSRKICKCKECNRLFLSKAKLNSHLKLHTTYRPYKCEHCNNRFANHSVCKKHKKAHLPYACNACGESWVTYMGLVNHTVSSHGVLRESLTASGSSHQPSTNKGHRCIYCNRRFCREAMRVRSHMRNHKMQYKLFWRKRLKVTMKGNAIGDFLMQTVKMSSSEGKEQADTIDGDEENKELEGDITVCAGSEPKEPQFACDTCGRKYAWKKSLVAHLKKERHGNVVVKSSEVGQNDTRTTTQSSRAQTGASKIIKSSQAQKDVNKTIQSSQPQMGASKITKSSQPQTGASKTTQSHQAQTTQSQKDASKTTQSSQPQPNISKTTQSSQPQPSASKTTKSSQSPNNVKEQSGAPYQCSDCSQTFTLWRLREEHIRRVHKNFTCQYCQKTFLVYQILMKHEKKHKAQGDVIKRQPDVGTGPKDVEKKDTEDRASVAQSEGQKDSQPSEGKHQEQSGGVENTTSPSNPSDKIQKVRLKKEPVSSDDSGASSGCSWEGESGDEDSSSDGSQTERRKSIQQKIKSEKKDELDGDTDEEDEKVSDFKCKTCGRSFRRKVSLIQHVRVHELEKLSDDEAGDVEQNSYKCDQCDRTFNRPVCLTVHKKTHTEKKYKCELCPKSFEKYLLLLRHNRSRHPGHKVIAPGSKVHVEKDQTFVCQVCFEEFPNANKMAEHKKIHSSESKFVCHVCDAVFHQSWDLIVHKRNHSRGDLRQHSIPQAGTSGQSSAITAQATSIPETQTSPTNVDHKCSFCGYVCTNNTHLAQHEEVHRTQFTCTFCGKVFDDNEMLLAHLKSIHYTVRSVDDGKSNMKGKNKKDDTRISHDLTVSDDDDDDNDNFSDFGGQADSDSPEEEEEEDVGRNRYPRRRSVKRKRYISSDDDEDVHEDDNRYPKRTRSRPLYAEPTDEQDLELNLVDDNKEQSGHDGGDKTENEPYKCSYCGIGFMLIDDWSFHEYQHAQNEPFRCQFCYRLFSRRSNLVQHERSHKGSKPYRCLQCGKQFAMDAHLKYHKEQDHANKPKDQSRHEKRSASSPAINPYPHNCGSCGKGFYQRSGLIKHQEKCADVENKVGSANEIGTPNPETPVREKNHACDMCDKRYYKISHLKEHQDRVHSGNSRSMKQKMTSVASPYVGERNAAKRARLQMVADQESSDVDDAADDVNFDAPEVESDDEPSKEAVVKQETDTLYKCRFCPKSFPFRKTLMNHEIKIHQAKGPHTCSSCDVAYWYPYELKRHEEGHKKKHIKPGPKEKFAEELSTAFKCHQCNQGFSSQALLLNHQQTHVEQQASIKCKFCLKMFPNEVELQKHEKTHTAPSDAPLSSFGCLFCHEMFTLKSALIDHIQTQSGRESYMCPHCDLTFPTSATLQAHEKEHFQPMLFQCSSCQALFRDKDQLVKHEASHKVNGYPCQFCGLKFIARKGLASHINSKHSKATTEQTSSSPLPHSKKTTMQPVVRLESLPQTLQSSTKATSSYPQQNEDVSSESEEEVTKEQEVNKEQEVDAIVNPYSCNVCKKSFPSPEDLKKHVRSHSKEHSRKCQYCGKEFQLHHVLKKHLKLHLRSLHSSTQDGAGEFKCQLCGIELQTKAGLVSHMKSHARSKAKPFSFHKRSTGFGFKQTQKASTSSVQVKPGKILKVPSVKKEKVSSSSSTSSPEKSPSGSKSVTCNYCNKAVHSNSLKRHIETIHAKDRPRKCQECDERFATKNELWDHVKKAHGGDGPSKAYGCDYCTSRYSSFINLTNHMDKAHPGATVTMGQQEIFRCKFCSKAFAQKKYVRRHELIHLRKGDQIPRNKAASSSSETPVTPPERR
ncbi:uncharacterized protein [Amphiura filiformis]|uniref:uncharacterized protein n=1 Tax=Amphiura filiformis TaxID=82378 RepID=UPI003B223E5C